MVDVAQYFAVLCMKVFLTQPLSYSDAKYREVDVVIKLWELGYAVPQA